MELKKLNLQKVQPVDVWTVPVYVDITQSDFLYLPKLSLLPLFKSASLLMWPILVLLNSYFQHFSWLAAEPWYQGCFWKLWVCMIPFCRFVVSLPPSVELFKQPPPSLCTLGTNNLSKSLIQIVVEVGIKTAISFPVTGSVVYRG